MYRNGRAAREPPVVPAAFVSTLKAGVASGAIKFTNSGDVGLVATIYGKAFAVEMAAADVLAYMGLGWDDGAMAALTALLEEGVMPNLKVLDLGRNQISDAGVAAIASALRGGAMPSCGHIHLNGNPGSDAKGRDGADSKVKEALASPERKACFFSVCPALARRQDELSA